MYNRLCFTLVSLFFLFSPWCVFAQFERASVQLTVSPPFPQAGDAYTVSLPVQAYQSALSAVTWFVDGIEQTASKDQRRIDLEANIHPTDITARLFLANGTTLEHTTTISPYRVDLIITANTRVPYFYRGASLLANGSDAYATALVFKDGKPVTGLTYLWKINNKVQRGGVRYEGNTLSFTPAFEDEVLVSVDVFNTNNQLIAKEVRFIPVAEPEIHFYEHNPLRGVLNIALQNPYHMTSEETAIRAEGYFIGANTENESLLQEWSIDNTPVESSPDAQNEILLRTEGQRGASDISFHIRNLENLLQGVKQTLTVTF